MYKRKDRDLTRGYVEQTLIQPVFLGITRHVLNALRVSFIIGNENSIIICNKIRNKNYKVKIFDKKNLKNYQYSLNNGTL